MGVFMSCCKPSSHDVITPDAETKRRQMMEAAEVRRAQAQARGVKDPGRLQRNQQRQDEMERRQAELDQGGGPTLKWTAN